MRITLLMITLYSLLLASSDTVYNRETDSLTLVELFKYIRGDFDPTLPLDEQDNVVLTNGRITELHFHGGGPTTGDSYVKELPSAIGNLNKLKSLLIGDGTGITTLPPEIGELKELEEIVISGFLHIIDFGHLYNPSCLSVLPNEFFTLPKIKMISFSESYLSYNDYARCKNSFPLLENISFKNVSPRDIDTTIAISEDSTFLYVLNPINGMEYNWFSNYKSLLPIPNDTLSAHTQPQESRYYCTPRTDEFTYYQAGSNKVKLPGLKTWNIVDSINEYFKIGANEDSTAIEIKYSEILPHATKIQWYFEKRTNYGSKHSNPYVYKTDTLEQSIDLTEYIVDLHTDSIQAYSTANDYSYTSYYYFCEIIIDSLNFFKRSNKVYVDEWMLSKVGATNLLPVHSTKQALSISKVRNQLKITTQDNTPISVTIFNAKGQLLQNQTLLPVMGGASYSISSNIALGTYFIKVQNNTTSITRKISISSN